MTHLKTTAPAHEFCGRWITDAAFAELSPRNVFFRQLQKIKYPPSEWDNSHILFRRRFFVEKTPREARLYITADDYFKLYINGRFVTQGPTAAYHANYGYLTVDVGDYLCQGENLIAVHTYYQGLVNRVWQSGDFRHGLLCDLVLDGEVLLSSDESFLVHRHTAYSEMGTVGYKTQFLERYDSRAPEVGFEQLAFDDSTWENARLRTVADWTVVPQPTSPLVFERIAPTAIRREGNRITYDFGSIYVGYLSARAKGRAGEVVEIRSAQETDDEGRVRFDLRANCRYEEEWILSGGEDVLSQFDYKAFRYVELTVSEATELSDVHLVARHYPFVLRREMKKEYRDDPALVRIWDLCVHSQRYGAQEMVLDCMEREKGIYVGDGCYSALVHLLLTGDDSIARKLIDDAFFSSFITDGLVTCVDCSYMQEIADYPLILVDFVLWHYRLVGDREYLAQNYPKICRLLEAYRRDYERDGLLSHLDKWCVVEWPANYRDGYAVDITEGKVCEEAHVSINAYYLQAIRTANRIAGILGVEKYRDEQPLIEAFRAAFYDAEQHLFCDGVEHRHVSYIGNLFPFGFCLEDDPVFEEKMLAWIAERGVSSTLLFATVPLLLGLLRRGHGDRIRACLLEEGAWLRMLREGATTTFEGWGKDCKWNPSLFHMTDTDAAIFLADVDLEELFK